MALSQKHAGKMFVPWFNTSEWKQVKALLYHDSSTVTTKQRALEILKVWKGRTPKLPQGVEGTLIILEAMLLEETVSLEMLQKLHGIAVMRFLNICAAGSHKQGTFYKIAKQNGVPDWLISLRHVVAHGHVMPSQCMLDSSLDFCFEWLKTEYWEKQDKTLADVIAPRKVKWKLSDLVESYCRLNIWVYVNNDIAYIKDLTEVDEKLYSKLCAFYDPDLELAETLYLLLEEIPKYATVEDGVLIANILIYNTNIFVVRATNNESVEKLQRFVYIWKDILIILYEKGMLPAFLQILLKFTITTSNKADKYTASVWLSALFESLLLTKQIHDKTNKKAESCSDENSDLEPWFPFDSENYTKVLNTIKVLETEAMSDPHEHTLVFLELLLELCDRSPDYISQKKLLVKTYIDPDETCSIDSLMHTVEELISLHPNCNIDSLKDATQDTAEVDVTNNKRDAETDNQGNVPKKTRFKLVTDESLLELFDKCPLGVMPTQNRDSLL